MLTQDHSSALLNVTLQKIDKEIILVEITVWNCSPRPVLHGERNATMHVYFYIMRITCVEWLFHAGSVCSPALGVNI